VKGYDRRSVALGDEYAKAVRRAHLENTRFVDWRAGRPLPVEEEDVPEVGTFAWMFDCYYESTAFKALAERSQQGYWRLIKRALKVKSQTGIPLARYKVKAMTPLAADKIYQRLLEGPRGQAVRVADHSVTIIKVALRVTRRHYRRYFPDEDPWADLDRIKRCRMKRACSPEQAYAPAKALREIGYPPLGLVALLCYEWHMRPENILTGCITWSDFRPAERPDRVRLHHGKTDVEVWMPLEINGQPIFARLEDYMAGVPRMGEAMVMTLGERGKPHLFGLDYASRRVREARAHAGLPSYVTFDACRHGGTTELGDADASEQGIMALSGHRSPQAMRR